jgi:hypothetical protein
MRKTYFLALLAAVFAFSSCDKFNNNIAPANQSLSFFKYYGHVYEQVAADVARTSDGGYIILGSSNSFVTENDRGIFYNFYVVRTDSLGNEIWSQSYGTSQFDNIAKRIIVLPDDAGYLLAGNRQRIDYSTGQALRAEKRITLIAIDLEGAIITESTLPDANNNGFDYEMNDIKMLENGDFALTGSTTNVNTNKPSFNSATDNTDIYTARVSNTLTISSALGGWQVADGFSGNDVGVSIHAVSNAFIVTGTTQTYNTQSTFNYDYIVVKYTPNFAAILNQQAYGDLGKNLIAADAAYDSVAGVLTILGNEQLSFAIGDDEPGELALMQCNVPNQRNNVISRSSVTLPSCIYTNGSSSKAGSGSKAASIMLLPNNAGFLATSTSTRIAGVNTDLHLMNISPQLQVQWDWLFGTGGTLERAASAILVQEINPDLTDPPVIGYAITGTFDFGPGNSMIGLIKTNTNGSITGE